MVLIIPCALAMMGALSEQQVLHYGLGIISEVVDELLRGSLVLHLEASLYLGESHI